MDIGLLVFRLGFGLTMFFGHGLSKLGAMGSEQAANFPDPIGLGPQLSQLAAALTEGLGAIFIALGLITRLSSFGLFFTMMVAAFLVHQSDPFFPGFVAGLSPEHPILLKPAKEFAFIYAIGFLGILLAGPGRFSIDYLIQNRRK